MMSKRELRQTEVPLAFPCSVTWINDFCSFCFVSTSVRQIHSTGLLSGLSPGVTVETLAQCLAGRSCSASASFLPLHPFLASWAFHLPEVSLSTFSLGVTNCSYAAGPRQKRHISVMSAYLTDLPWRINSLCRPFFHAWGAEPPKVLLMGKSSWLLSRFL